MPERHWLVIRLEGPMVAFGGVTIDHVGIIRDFPAASMLTGLLANALGWHRTDRAAHQLLQDRLVFGVRWERGPFAVLTDTQNAGLTKQDCGWTTFGMPEGRAGASYDAPHRRRRDYHLDACVTVALRLEPPTGKPDLDDLAAALDYPARPLFIGRKSCLPAAPLRCGEVVAATAHEALCRLERVDSSAGGLLALWPPDEGPVDGDSVYRIMDLADLRNWQTGLHGGTRRIVEGVIQPEGGIS